ncbi:SCO family protein [Salimicrobium humidisoli]|uniref:Cytochrome c oxidase assembly protein n=1 Tax=Salimicrobium humidisoli TaxID=2029857 RepID=A0ABX4HS24_9BACI|nr:SCO family protein [Salimicrobium humidisoli]PBB06016.1 cytochrome c oxidase assembly protein [Salimicrobium humidisoli]
MKKLWILILFTLFLAACGQKELEDPVDWETGSLEATTHENKSFSMEDMEGKVWIADFVFTSCNTVCPPMTRNMAQLQDKLEEAGVDAEIVSFSVDPTVDDPETLQSFGEKQGADFSNWTFVTGYDQQTIESFAKESFHIIVDKPEGEEQVTHGTQFFLVDEKGTVKKYYDGIQDVPYEQIVEDAEIVENN